MKDLVLKTLDLIQINKDEWEPRFDGYADSIIKNSERSKFEKAKKFFHVRKPFGVYISTGNAIKSPIKGTKVQYSLRYVGQEIAKLTVDIDKEQLRISTNSEIAKNNMRDFGCDITLNNAEWKSKDAEKFRKYFQNYKQEKKSNKEHLFESLILSEMCKKRNKKFFRGIQPITIGNVRFSMTTPLSASHDGVTYSGRFGGGIDLFTRTKSKSGKTHLNIMELKDENKASESPEKVIKQAIKYAVFIQQLLRSKSGEKWWKIFNFKGKLPKKITLYATCVMPYDEKNNNCAFANNPIYIGDDEIELHYLYFKYNKDENGMYSITDTSVTSLTVKVPSNDSPTK